MLFVEIALFIYVLTMFYGCRRDALWMGCSNILGINGFIATCGTPGDGSEPYNLDWTKSMQATAMNTDGYEHGQP